MMRISHCTPAAITQNKLITNSAASAPGMIVADSSRAKAVSTDACTSVANRANGDNRRLSHAGGYIYSL